MRKLVLWLVISLGLVNVANAESVCNSYSIEYMGIGYDMSYFATGNDKAKDYWNKLVMRYYNAEIKKSDKETICVYMVTTGQGYLDTELTPQEIEQFERFLVEKSHDGAYERFEKNKEYFLKVLKFFKYHNKLDVLYNKEYIRIMIYRPGLMGDPYTMPQEKDNLAMVEDRLREYENEARVVVKRFVYNKDMGDYFGDWYSRPTIKQLKEMNSQDAKNIAKWAESKLKESK